MLILALLYHYYSKFRSVSSCDLFVINSFYWSGGLWTKDRSKCVRHKLIDHTAMEAVKEAARMEEVHAQLNAARAVAAANQMAERAPPRVGESDAVSSSDDDGSEETAVVRQAWAAGAKFSDGSESDMATQFDHGSPDR